MNQGSLSRHHEAWPDIAKGVGILLVVYGHVARGIEKAGLPIDPHVFAAVDAWIYAFHMPLFFFVSGYLMWGSLQAKGHRHVTASRLHMLLWLYVLWSVGHGAVEVAMAHFTNGGLTWSEVFRLWVPRAHFWYLYALALMVLMTGATSLVAKKLQLPVILALAVLLYVWPGMGTGWYPLLVISWYLIYFAIGLLVGWLLSEKIWQLTSLLEFVAVTTLAPLALLSVAIGAERGTDLFWAGAGIVATVGLSVLLPSYSRKLGSGLAYLGSLALPIYLAHILAGSGTRIVLQRVLHIDNVWVHLTAGVAAAVFLPLSLWVVSNRLGALWLWRSPVAAVK